MDACVSVNSFFRSAVHVTQATQRWFALYTAPQREWLANELLEDALGKANVFLPYHERERKPSRHSKRREPMKIPLLTRYLFAACGLHSIGELLVPLTEQIFRAIFPFPSIILGVISMNGRAVPIRDAGIAWLRGMTVNNETIPTGAIVDFPFADGDPVRLTVGPFQGFPARFVALNEDDQSLTPKRRKQAQRIARIMLHLFGSPQLVEVPLEDIEPA